MKLPTCDFKGGPSRNYIHDERPWTEQKSQFGQNAFAFGQEQEIEEDATFDTSVNGTSLWVQKTWCWLEKQSKNNNKRYVLLQFPHLFCSRGRLEQHRNPPPQKFSLEFFRKKEPSIFTFYCARSGQTRFYCCVVLFLYLTLKTFQQSNAFKRYYWPSFLRPTLMFILTNDLKSA